MAKAGRPKKGTAKLNECPVDETKKSECHKSIEWFLIDRWNFLLFLVNSDFILFNCWWDEQKKKPEPSMEGCEACYNALQRIVDVSQKFADRKAEGLCNKIGHSATLRRAMIPFFYLEEAFRCLEERKYIAALSNALDAHNEFLNLHFQRAIERKKDGQVLDTAFGVGRMFEAVLKDMKDEREKKVFSKGRPIATQGNKDRAKNNWEIIDKAIEDFFISGKGFLREWTNPKMTDYIFDNFGKKLGYEKSTIAQHVKIKAAEYRKKHAQK